METPADPLSNIVVMGVTACGKSSVGALLAQQLGRPFCDGDSLHPPANIAKMEAGLALDDDDRWPWLRLVGMELRQTNGLIIACSALKRSYRDTIRKCAARPVLFIHLTGTKQLLASRMGERQGHFMPIELLDSQLDTLEPPSHDEASITIDFELSVDQIVAQTIKQIPTLETII